MVLSILVLFSCKGNFSEVQKIGLSEDEPIGIADTFNLKYTDSGRLKANLVSPKMFDYSNRNFSYLKFPDGAHLDIFDDENKKSTVTADFAYVYNNTGLIDMRGNVVLNTTNQDTLFAEQLFYDQEKEWLFTNKPVTFKTNKDLINGRGFDSNSKFTNAEVLEVDGIISLEE